MKISRILPVVGMLSLLTLLACGAAFAQMQNIPVGSAAGVHRQPPGSRFHHHPTKPTHAHRSATSPDKRKTTRAH
jgi:hypothetical protein